MRQASDNRRNTNCCCQCNLKMVFDRLAYFDRCLMNMNQFHKMRFFVDKNLQLAFSGRTVKAVFGKNRLGRLAFDIYRQRLAFDMNKSQL